MTGILLTIGGFVIVALVAIWAMPKNYTPKQG